ncbi:MAG: FAD-binding oxidoreductase [Alistipes sp.]|nr:FAD-binding oxidoreductase [Candidatus Alistipes equi]
MKVYKDKIRRIAWGTDASFYRLIPQKVIIADSESEVSNILKKCYRRAVPVTFRAAGTSLSGQSISDSVLLVAGKGWEKYSINGDTITLEPGIVGAKVNQILSPLGRKFGPDPASIGSCMVGGIVANNASGMSCGVWANSDRLLLGARIVLANGAVLDTLSAESRDSFRKTHPELLSEIESIRSEIISDDEFRRRIEYKYSIKNVTGLNLRPFVAYEDPFDIIAHLMVGSEGTLGFLSTVTMLTLPIEKYSCSAMIYFNSIEDAARAVVELKSLNVSAAELLDRRSLLSVSDNSGDTALLIQLTATTEEELQNRSTAVTEVLANFDTVNGVVFTSDKETVERFWRIRSGIFPTVGGMRPLGTTSLIEDVAFHIEDLPSATKDLSRLLDKHGYDDSCIYGHALEGNFHFIINQSFSSEDDKKRYQALIEDVVAMVVEKYDGSLKAEHGTGRNMAPFVIREWGEKAFGYMKRIKRAFDQKGILNPGVIFNDDHMCYLKDIKALPVLGLGNIDKCIECGFCEVNCMSCGFTLSSRTRMSPL